jgi:RNA polymerase sigma factor (sigma-70 family)
MRTDVEQGFEEFARAPMVQLERLGRALAGDDHEAKDLVQSTLEKLYLVWGRRTITNEAGYARATLIRIFLSGGRSKSARYEVIGDVSDRADRSDDLHACVTRVDVIRALQQLPPRQRAAVVLRYLEDLSIEETAREMDSGEGNVKRLSHDGLNRLRQLIPNPLGVLE